MGFKRVGKATFRQDGKSIVKRDLYDIAKLMNEEYNGEYVEVEIQWETGPSTYGVDLDGIEEMYNVRLIM